MTIKAKKLIGGILGVVLAVAISLCPIPEFLSEVLTRNSFIALGCLVGAVVWMLLDVLPDYLATTAMCVAWVVTGAVPLSTAFITFSGSTWWLLFGALCIGVAASQSGLLKRMALQMMNIFPANFRGQSIAMVISGIVISPLIPSTAAKSAIVAPLARNISESMCYEPCSKPANGMFMSFYTGYVSAGMGFLSASFISYSLVGLMPEGQEIGWFDWFLYSLPWLVVAILLMTIAIQIMYRPKNDQPVSKESIVTQLKEMGPMTGKEKITLAVMLVCLILWMLEKTLGISSAMVAVAGGLVLIGAGVFGRQEFRSKIAWDSMIFIGTFLCISDVFAALGINDAVKILLGDSLAPLIQNPWILIPSLCLLTFVIRFVVVSWTASAVLIPIILLPLCSAYGVHPWIVAFTCYCSTNTWNVIYQNTPYIAALVATDNKLGTHNQLLPFSVVYMITSTIGCMACIPLWMLLGLC